MRRAVDRPRASRMAEIGLKVAAGTFLCSSPGGSQRSAQDCGILESDGSGVLRRRLDPRGRRRRTQRAGSTKCRRNDGHDPAAGSGTFRRAAATCVCPTRAGTAALRLGVSESPSARPGSLAPRTRRDCSCGMVHALRKVISSSLAVVAELRRVLGPSSLHSMQVTWPATC